MEEQEIEEMEMENENFNQNERSGFDESYKNAQSFKPNKNLFKIEINGEEREVSYSDLKKALSAHITMEDIQSQLLKLEQEKLAFAQQKEEDLQNMLLAFEQSKRQQENAYHPCSFNQEPSRHSKPMYRNKAGQAALQDPQIPTNVEQEKRLQLLQAQQEAEYRENILRDQLALHKTEIHRQNVNAFLNSAIKEHPIIENENFRQKFIENYCAQIHTGDPYPKMDAVLLQTKKQFQNSLLSFVDSENPEHFKQLLGDERLNKIIKLQSQNRASLNTNDKQQGSSIPSSGSNNENPHEEDYSEYGDQYLYTLN